MSIAAGPAALPLDELEPSHVQVGYGDLGRRGWLGYEGGRVTVAGRVYESALSTHPPVLLRFAIPSGRVGLGCGNISRRAPQKPSAPSPTSSTGARIPPAGAVAQQVGPRLGGLPVPHPGDVDLLISLATALAAQDKTMEAVRVLHRATSVAPESARAWTQLGVVALVRQGHGTAGEALLRALDLDPDNPEARFHLAVLHVLVRAGRGGAGGAAGPDPRGDRVRGGGTWPAGAPAAARPGSGPGPVSRPGSGRAVIAS